MKTSPGNKAKDWPEKGFSDDFVKKSGKVPELNPTEVHSKPHAVEKDASTNVEDSQPS